MRTNSQKRQPIWRGLTVAGIAAGALFAVSTTALAGECPADKRGVDIVKPVTIPPKGVSDMVLASIDLATEKLALDDHKFRLRKLVIQPGGEVPWHSHAARPALIYIVEGEIFEYSSDCAVPILHKAGDVSPETKGVAH
jgi:quercetin dioxygenase-like cupin family protein